MDWQDAGSSLVCRGKTCMGSRKQLLWQWFLARKAAVERKGRLEEFLI